MAKTFNMPSIESLKYAEDYHLARGISKDNPMLRVVGNYTAKHIHGFWIKNPVPTAQTMYIPYSPNGFGVLIRQYTGEFPVDAVKLKPTWPEEDIYKFVQGEDGGKVPQKIERKDLPKWLFDLSPRYLGDGIFWACDPNELCKSKFFVITEKHTNAILFATEKGWPCVGLPGCWGYSKNHELTPTLKAAIMVVPKGCTICVMNDGDVREIHGDVFKSARKLKSEIHAIRKDVEVIFVPPPFNKDNPKYGWDDWWVDQGGDAAAKIDELLNESQVEVPFVYCDQELLEMGVGIKVAKNGVKTRYSTLSALTCLLVGMDEFRHYRHDYISDCVYSMDEDGVLTIRDMEEFRRYVQTTLEDRVYNDCPKSPIVGKHLDDAIETFLLSRNRCLPLDLLDFHAPEPDLSKEESYAQDLIKAAGIIGPMSTDEAAKTLLRMARDQVHTWAWDDKHRMEFVCFLSGPAGAGKSSFLGNLLGKLNDFGAGFMVGTAVAANGNVKELGLSCLHVLSITFDELRTRSKDGHELFDSIMNLTTNRVQNFRLRYARYDTSHNIYSMIACASTTAESLTGDKNEGMVRRIIPFSLVGSPQLVGKNRPDHVKIAEAWWGILSCARWRQLNGRDVDGLTHEYAENVVDTVYATSPIVERISNLMAIGNSLETLKAQLLDFGRTSMISGEIRFTRPVLSVYFGLADADWGRDGGRDFLTFLCECGARKLAREKYRLNVRGVGKTVKADSPVYAVDAAQWVDFVNNVIERL